MNIAVDRKGLKGKKVFEEDADITTYNDHNSCNRSIQNLPVIENEVIHLALVPSLYDVSERDTDYDQGDSFNLKD